MPGSPVHVTVSGASGNVIYALLARIASGQLLGPDQPVVLRLLDIELIRYNDEVRLSDYHHSVFLDNQGTTTALTERLEAAGVKPLIIIDHHEPQNIIEAPFTDIRPLSATADIADIFQR